MLAGERWLEQRVRSAIAAMLAVAMAPPVVTMSALVALALACCTAHQADEYRAAWGGKRQQR